MIELRDKLNSLNVGNFVILGENVTASTAFAYGLGVPAELGLPEDAEVIWCGGYILYYDRCSQVFFDDLAAVIRFFELVVFDRDVVRLRVDVAGCEWANYENGDEE